MKAYTGCRKRAARQYNGNKSELCFYWKAPLVKWCRRVDRQEAKAEIREQLAVDEPAQVSRRDRRQWDKLFEAMHKSLQM